MNFTDNDELANRLKRRKRRQRSDVFWNFLTLCVVLATLALAGVLAMIFSNPYISLNPFPPPTMPVLVIYPTATPTLVMMPPTWTPTTLMTETQPSEPETATPTAVPTFTTVADTPSAQTATMTPTTNDTSSPLYSFGLQGAPAGLRVDVFKAGTGCAWQGVAGHVVDMQGAPLVNYGIILKGIYNNKTISMQTISGTHTEYGESGYEFQLGTSLVPSTGQLSIQMVDQAGLPLSDAVIFDTYSTCDRNLVMINFKQVK